MESYVVSPIIGTTASSATPHGSASLHRSSAYRDSLLLASSASAMENFPSFPLNPSVHAIPDTPGESVHACPIPLCTDADFAHKIEARPLHLVVYEATLRFAHATACTFA